MFILSDSKQHVSVFLLCDIVLSRKKEQHRRLGRKDEQKSVPAEKACSMHLYLASVEYKVKPPFLQLLFCFNARQKKLMF